MLPVLNDCQSSKIIFLIHPGVIKKAEKKLLSFKARGCHKAQKCFRIDFNFFFDHMLNNLISNAGGFWIASQSTTHPYIRTLIWHINSRAKMQFYVPEFTELLRHNHFIFTHNNTREFQNNALC